MRKRCPASRPAAARPTAAVIGRLRPEARKGVVIIDGAGRSGRRRRRRIVVVVVVPVFTHRPQASASTSPAAGLLVGLLLLLLLVIFVLDRLARRIDTERQRRVIGRMAVIVRLLVNHLDQTSIGRPAVYRPAVVDAIKDDADESGCQ